VQITTPVKQDVRNVKMQISTTRTRYYTVFQKNRTPREGRHKFG